jgi:tagatose 1,6-diphosphate aldolase
VTVNSVAVERRLARLRGPDGIVIGLAIDHRDSMTVALRRSGVARPSPGLVTRIKADICRMVAPLATAVMLDSEYGRIAMGDVAAARAGLIMPLEAQGYEKAGLGHLTTLMTGFDPHIASTVFGADACKLLLPFRAGHESAPRQVQTAHHAAELCHREGLPLVLEPVIDRLPGESPDDYVAAYPQHVVDVVMVLRECGVDMFKLPFPAPCAAASEAADACRAVMTACDTIPWVLLGGAAGQAELESQLRLARRFGSDGFLVGRTIWTSALVADPADRELAIVNLVEPAFRRLIAICHRPDRGAGSAIEAL